MRERVVAKRYGRALFELALESGDPAGVASDVERLRRASEEVPLFVRALADERAEIPKRLRAAAGIAAALGLGKEAGGAFRLLVGRGRVALLPLVADDFKARMERHQKLRVARLGVAEEGASESIRGKIEEILSQALSAKARCDVEVDADLIGGFTLAVGDVRYDASIRGRLERMKEELL